MTGPRQHELQTGQTARVIAEQTAGCAKGRFPDLTNAATVPADLRHFHRRVCAAPSSANRVVRTSDLPREDDVLFRPIVDLGAVGAAHFMRLELGVAPRFFFNRLASRRQLRG